MSPFPKSARGVTLVAAAAALLAALVGAPASAAPVVRVPAAGAAGAGSTAGSAQTAAAGRSGVTAVGGRAAAGARDVHAAATLRLRRAGTVNLRNLAAAARRAPSGGQDARAARGIRSVPFGLPPAARHAARGAARTGPARPAGRPSSLAGPGPGTTGFPGLTGAQQAAANGGGDLEPPDQGLCAGPSASGTVVVEFVNNALAIYSPDGHLLAGPVPSYRVFGQPASAFMSDPRCYYDGATGRWFLSEFIVGTTNKAGTKATSPSVQFLAVSAGPSPFGNFGVFSFETTDAGQPGCPCFGDFDQLGADANGIYLSTNEFGITLPSFNGADIWALSKQALEQAAAGGGTPSVLLYRVPADPFGQPFHVSPTVTPPGGAFAPGTEYFAESNSNLNADNHLVVYALTDTGALNGGGQPVLAISPEISSLGYAFPAPASQRLGPIPLGASVSEPEGQLRPDTNAIQEVTYTGGLLYAELSTATSGGGDGVDWFVLRPWTSASAGGPAAGAAVVNQGLVTSSQNLLYPDIAVDAAGHGYLVMSVSGPGAYPSAASMTFAGPAGAVGPVRVAAAGTAPEDGFTCYAAFVGPGKHCRWGDYSMGVAWGGRIYQAAEYIPPLPRDHYTNWGTFIWSQPSLP